ncbi:MAG: hypothetical protein A2Z91_09520 [Deltaproteobacteria bacterium GWA2_38_16]|nr:MAG: hypothetical protein A2Z91_09520 [Deltaproteobacteria bacterium GWA2_38_16]OGQ02468.1 MAG: hypothetical protein A3D19_09210 [Deltaproteobacteria bacterium RIFCSPHIGHO2_02_FULL_38_15]OGQ62183.1 MAG: hypothetical protein A3G92_07730 [Deltaproteobacteria bacterium RIFCSPLOWO2_12_FULL_38_8]
MTLSKKNKNLEKLGKDYWEFLMKENPTWATFLGDKRYNDRLEEIGPKARARCVAQHKKFLKRLKKIKPTQLSYAEKISYSILKLKLKEYIDAQKYKDWEWNMDHLFGLHIQLMDLLEIHPLKTKKNYQDLLSRYKQIPKAFDQFLGDLRVGLKSGRVAPYVAYDRTLKQLEQFLAQKPMECRFSDAVKNFPKTFLEKDKQKLRGDFEKVITTSVVPAYQKFHQFLKEEYQGKARREVGVSAIPGGRENYCFRVKVNTTTDKTPEELHQLGLEELEKNKEEILAISRKLGHSGDLKSFLEQIKGDRANYFTSREALMNKHQTTLEGMKTLLPKYFGKLPSIPFEIKEMEAYKAPSAPAAYYYPPAEDGSRPGIFWMNTHKPEDWANYSMETLAFHEAIPGHHLQISLATEQKNIPQFQRHIGFTAYVEGWAHYTERLADEMGAYSSDLQRVGMLMDQAWRAIRLVVDTGIHYLGWSREKALNFMRETRTANDMEMNNEIDRYIVWPGQALAYKVGQRTIYDLREWAKGQLKDKFDIRGFHDVVLLSGPVPLTTLKDMIEDWVETKQKNV